MEKKFKWLIASAVVFTSSLGCLAQNADSYTPLSGNLDFLAVDDYKLQTTTAFQGDELEEWTCEGYHVGFLKYSFILFNHTDIPRGFESPERVDLCYSVKDTEGNEVKSLTDDLTSVIRKAKFSRKFRHECSGAIAIARGGEYVVSTDITPDLYHVERTITVNDQECMRVDVKRGKVGEVLSPKLTLTSGYPYDAAAFAGEKTLTWTVAPADDPSQVIEEHTEAFTMTSASPTLAAEATISLPVDGLEAGTYLFTVTSEYLPACRTFEAYVDDVLKADVALDKQQYTLGKDTEARVALDLKYGYPYITPEEDGIPTITVATEFLGVEKRESFSDEAWENSALDFVTEVAVPFNDVTAEMLRNNNGELPLEISVIFNGQKHYEGALTIRFDGYAGIEGIPSGNAVESVTFYNLLGIPAGDSFRGIAVGSDGRKVLK